jgi:hypothetical protein
LDIYYRISRNGNQWTNWLPLVKDEILPRYFQVNSGLNNTVYEITNFPPFDPKYNMFIDVKWIRKGDSKIGQIKIINYKN